MTGSVSVSVSVLPTLYSVTGGGNFCSGGAGAPIGLAASATGISYQLYNGTTAVGSPLSGTGAALNFGLQTGAGIYTVQALSTVSTCAANMPGSATVSINPLPAAYTVTGGGTH